MIGTGSHPAVFAGLLGSASWGGAPTLAIVSPIDDVAAVVSHSLLLQFVLGCAIGAAIAGVISFVSERMARDEEEHSDGKQGDSAEEDDFWRTSSLSLMQAERAAGENDPTGDLGRFRTGQISIDAEGLVAEALAAKRGPRHFAPSQRSRVGSHGARAARSQAARHHAGKHFASAAKPVASAAAVAAAPRSASARGKHFAGSVAPARREPMARSKATTTQNQATSPELQAGAVPMRPLATPAVRSRPQSAEDRRARLASLPVIDASYNTVREAPAAAHLEPVSTVSQPQTAQPQNVQQRAVQGLASAGGRVRRVEQDTMDLFRPLDDSIASIPLVDTPSPGVIVLPDNPAPSLTSRIRNRVAAKAKSVREVLSERLSSNALDGVPIIERADGSVLDLTPSWFDQTLVPAVASITSNLTKRIDDTVPRMDDEPKAERIQADEPSRAEYISRHVAEVNVGMFPERRTGEELEHEDEWEQSMVAMGETIAQNSPAPVFRDMVGGPSTIDDPDGLEPATGFLPFRVPAAHPEVVDMGTYIDYLLRDEISQNGSVVLTQSPHAHLRVIEGGSGKLDIRRKLGPNDSGPVRRGRHFAAAPFAAEA